MEKSTYLSKVGEIFATLESAILDYKSGKIDNKEMKAIALKAFDERPKGLALVDIDLCDILEIDESLCGEVISLSDYIPESQIKESDEFLRECLNSIDRWTPQESFGQASVCGSNSILALILGDAEWHLFAFNN